MTPVSEDKKAKYELYREWVTERTGYVKDVDAELDRAIVNLCSGALVLSITFIGLFLQVGILVGVKILLFAWLLLILALIFNLLSRITALLTVDEQKVLMDQWVKASEYVDPKLTTRWHSITPFLHYASFLMLIGGLSLFPVFAWQNISHMTKKQMIPGSEEKGLPPLSPPVLPPPTTPTGEGISASSSTTSSTASPTTTNR